VETATQSHLAETDGGAALSTASTEQEISPVAVANIILRRRSLVVNSVAVVTVITVLGPLACPSYESRSQFKPAQASALSSLAAVAAQLGADVSGLAAQTEPLDFWAQLLESRDLLAQIARTRFSFPSGPGKNDTISGTPIELYGVSEDTPEETLLAAAEHLADDISVKTDLTSGIVTLIVKAQWPALAEQINRELLKRLNDFNLHTRQSQAAAEAAFAGQRLLAARDELLAAEDSLRRFLEENRTYQTSPRLVFEVARLQRRVDLRQQVYTMLAQVYERARIEEVRNTPVITILESPEGSAKRTMGVLASLVLGLVLGGVVGMVGALAGEFVRRQRLLNTADVAEFEAHMRRAVPRWLVGVASRVGGRR
jgi:uncharacterized protein involved in exopolysaccharide biosynthesis